MKGRSFSKNGVSDELARLHFYAALVKNNLNTLVSDIRRLLAIARVSRIGLETGSEAA